MDVLNNSILPLWEDIASGPTTERYHRAMQTLGASMAKAGFVDRLDGKTVVVAVRPEDADGFGNGVINALVDLGASVRLACLWMDRDYRTTEASEPKYIAGAEFFEPLYAPVDFAVLAIPVLPGTDLAGAMWEAIAKRCTGSRLIVLCGMSSRYDRHALRGRFRKFSFRTDGVHVAALVHDVRPPIEFFTVHRSVDHPIKDVRALVPMVVRDRFKAALELARGIERHPGR